MTNTKKEALLTSVLLTQQFSNGFWDDDWNKEILESEDIEKILEEIVRRVSQVATVSEAYAIKHDKDTSVEFDKELQETTTKLAKPHIHALLKFKKGKGATRSTLAKKIGLEEQHLEKSKSGRYGYDNLLAYLIHAKDKDKYQYTPDEVVTLAGKDYLEVYHQRKESWLKGKAKKEVNQTYEDIDLLIDNILNEYITKNEILLEQKYRTLYAVHKARINDTFRTVGEIKGTRTKYELDNEEFKKTILFIHGSTGLGKSKFAKELTKDIVQLAKLNGQNWQSVVTAATNIFDEVNGEEILFLDDVRGDSLTASDWLKLLDPFNISPISARYQNKMGAAKVIIITSSKYPLDFFYNTKGNDREDLSQYVRRIECLATIKGNDKNPKFYVSYPQRMEEPVKTILENEQEVSLSYDFTDDSLLNSRQDLLSTLLSKIAINNQWDILELDKSKTPSETLASKDEVEDNQEK